MTQYKTVPVEPTPEMVDALITATHATDCPIQGLRAAIAEAPQPAGETVAWLHTGGHVQVRNSTWGADITELYTRAKGWTPLYTTPPDTEAMLRQALEELRSCNGVPHWPAMQPTIAAIRKHLGEPT